MLLCIHGLQVHAPAKEMSSLGSVLLEGQFQRQCQPAIDSADALSVGGCDLLYWATGNRVVLHVTKFRY